MDNNVVVNKFIEQANDNIVLASIGYVHTNKDICKFNAFNILNCMQYVYDELSDTQKEKLNQIYNTLIL